MTSHEAFSESPPNRTCGERAKIDANDPFQTSGLREFFTRRSLQNARLYAFGSDLFSGTHMRRREFITLLGGAVPLWPLAASAQQPAVPVIGYLSVGSPDVANPHIEAAFERGLAERGYVVGRNVTIERRSARGNHYKLPELAQELVHLNPAVIVGGGNVVALAARRATSTIPIVFAIASDPVKLGLAKSFTHPGGNATGISLITATLVLKRLELIQELLQQNATVGFW
jgi:putative ABC transport system substrate-binding protein